MDYLQIWTSFGPVARDVNGSSSEWMFRRHSDHPLNQIVHSLPFADWKVAAMVLVWYWVGLWYFRRRSATPFMSKELLRNLVAWHNNFVCIASLILFLIALYEVAVFGFRKGFHALLCDEDVVSWPMVGVIYANYLLKFYELLDTFFIVWNNGKLTFLHVYHHSMTLVLVVTQLQGMPAMQWVPIEANLFVHFVMYRYYYLIATGVKYIPWKIWVTRLQIVQFVLDLAACLYCSYHYEVSDKGCVAHRPTSYFACFVLGSYLLLFIQFYFSTYNKEASSRPKGQQVEGRTERRGSKPSLPSPTPHDEPSKAHQE